MPTIDIIKPTKAHARQIADYLSTNGLRKGGGDAKPGEMCVEQLVCHVIGYPYSDNPLCVAPAVRSFKIALNDSCWSSDTARAKGMARIAIAQLGSNEIDEKVFVKELALATIRKIVPIALRAAAGMSGLPVAHKQPLLDHATKCEGVDTLYAARAASDAASAASAASYAARAASYAASDAASDAASYAASAASYAARAASDAASYAARAAKAASDAASYAARAASYAASDAASDAASYAASAARAAKDEVFCLMAEIGVQALKKAGSPGCKWLGLVEAA